MRPFTVNTQVDAPDDAACKSYAFSIDTQVSTPFPREEDHEWVSRHGGVAASSTTIRLTLQGRSTNSVVLHALRVTIDSRKKARGAIYFPHPADFTCGGIPERYFDVNLDVPQPSVAPSAGYDGDAVDFPYRISSTEPEVILVVVNTEKCDCRFHLDLDWTSEEHKGTLRIHDGKNPFRVIGSGQLPYYELDEKGQRWVRTER
jgi:hypothetical protein